MDPFPPNDFLLSLWTYTSPTLRLSIVLQCAALIVGLVPAARRRLRDVPSFTALVVGPPLMWALFECSVGMILSCEVTGDSILPWILNWVVRMHIIIGATALLQLILAIQFTSRPQQNFPVVGVMAALLAIMGDALFLVAMITRLSW